LWALGKGRECTFISQQPSGHVHISLEKLQKRNALVFHVIEPRLHRQVDNLARMGQVRQEEAELESTSITFPSFFSPVSPPGPIA